MGIVKEPHIFKSGKMRGEIVRYPDGAGCTIWMPISEDDDSPGCCFDFKLKDAQDLRNISAHMSLATVDKMGLYERDKEDEYWDKKEEERKTWWYCFKWFLRDIGLHVEPFNWSFRIGSKRKIAFYTVKDAILSLGPIKITFGTWRDLKKNDSDNTSKDS